jgi:hypothetical protein
VYGNDDVKKNLHFLSCFPSLPNRLGRNLWCGGGDNLFGSHLNRLLLNILQNLKNWI